MEKETQDFVKTWKLKLDRIKGNELSDLFERYTSLFTLYNRLYNDSFKILEASKRLTKTRYSDFEKATKLVVEYNTAADIIGQLQSNNNITDLKVIADLILKDIFHINLADGVSQKKLDIELMNNLLSDNPEVKSQAALSTIYNVRNNMQHGEKHFEEHQRLLLEPLLRILETIVELQIDKLN